MPWEHKHGQIIFNDDGMEVHVKDGQERGYQPLSELEAEGYEVITVLGGEYGQNTVILKRFVEPEK